MLPEEELAGGGLTKRSVPDMFTWEKTKICPGRPRGGTAMTKGIPPQEIKKGIHHLLQLRQKMNTHKHALLKSGQKDMDYHQRELIKLDHDYGMARQRLLYSQPKEQAKAILAFLRKRPDEYVRPYKDVFDDLLVQVMNYVEEYEDPADLTSEELDLE
jgi:hypothetical protein